MHNCMDSAVQTANAGVKERVLDFLSRYGEKGYLILRLALDAAKARQQYSVKLGDFSYRDITSRLRTLGVSYNPNMLLRILERDYGVIETTYHSSSQHWWKFVDIEAVEEALEDYEKGVNVEEDEEEILDPRLELVRIQVAALQPYELLSTLRLLAAKPRLRGRDLSVLQDIAFNKLPRLVEVLEKAREYADELADEIYVMEEVLRLASRIARRLLREAKKSETVLVEALVKTTMPGVDGGSGSAYGSA